MKLVSFVIRLISHRRACRASRKCLRTSFEALAMSGNVGTHARFHKLFAAIDMKNGRLHRSIFVFPMQFTVAASTSADTLFVFATRHWVPGCRCSKAVPTWCMSTTADLRSALGAGPIRHLVQRPVYQIHSTRIS